MGLAPIVDSSFLLQLFHRINDQPATDEFLKQGTDAKPWKENPLPPYVILPEVRWSENVFRPISMRPEPQFDSNCRIQEQNHPCLIRNHSKCLKIRDS